MKKLLSAALVCAMLVGVLAMLPLSVSAEAVPNNAHQSHKMHALEGTPVVDGIVDDKWAEAEIQKFIYKVEGDGQLKNQTPEQIAQTADLQYRVMWDKDKIYFLIEIKDDELSPDFHIPTDPTSQGSDWWRTDSLFMYVSETAMHTGYSAGNSYQLVLPLTEEYYESAIIRKGEKDTGHPIKDSALVRKTVVDGNNAVIELSLELKEENVKDNHIGQTMSVGFQYHDVDASSTWAKAYKEDGKTNPRTLCITSSYNHKGESPDTGTGKNNWQAIKLTRKVDVLKATAKVDGDIDAFWAAVPKAELNNIVTLNGATSESGHPEKVDSASAYVKTVYDDSKIYMLFVVNDDDYCYGQDTDWKNDSFMVKIGENKNYFVGDTKGNDADANITYASTDTYQISVHPNEKGAYVRSGKGNADNISFEHSAKITGNEDSGYTFVIELAITLKNFQNGAGNRFYAEYQYNDANPTYDAAGNNRDIVINWTCGDLGMGVANCLSIMEMSENEPELISTDKDVYFEGDPIMVTPFGGGADWVGIWADGDETTRAWQYIDTAKGGKGSGVALDIVKDRAEDKAAELPAGEYIVGIIPNDMTLKDAQNQNVIVATKTIKILPSTWDETLDGEYDILAMDGTPLESVTFDKEAGTLTVDTTVYKYRGTLADGCIILDAQNNQVGTITKNRIGLTMIQLGKMQGELVEHTENIGGDDGLVVGANAIEVTDVWNGTTVTFTAPEDGKYTFGWADGEVNGSYAVETAPGFAENFFSDTNPQTTYVKEMKKGETVTLMVYLVGMEADVIDIVVTQEAAEVPETGDAAMFIVLTAILSLGVAVVAMKKRQSVR